MKKKQFKTVSFDKAIELAKQGRKVYLHEFTKTSAITTRDIRQLGLGTLLDKKETGIFQVLDEQEE